MQKFRICLKIDWDPKMLETSSRIYQNLLLKRKKNGVDWSKLSEKPIKSLHMYEFDYNLLLSVKDSLEILEIGAEFVRRYDSIYPCDRNVELKKVKTLIINKWDDSYEKLVPNTLEVFSIRCLNRLKSTALLKSINRQKNLNFLEIFDYTQNGLYKNPAYKFVCNIQLKNLSFLLQNSSSIKMFTGILQKNLDFITKLTLYCGPAELNELASAISQIKKLEQFNFQLIGSGDFTSPHFNCPTIKSFSMSNSAFSSNYAGCLAQLIKGMPNLEKLKCDGGPISKAEMKEISHHARNLKNLEIYSVLRDIFEASEFENVLRMKLTHNTVVGAINFRNILVACPNLQEFALDRIGAADNFATIFKTSKTLKILEIDDGSRLPPEILEVNQKLLKDLKVLRIKNFTRQTESSRKIFINHPTLKSYFYEDEPPEIEIR